MTMYYCYYLYYVHSQRLQVRSGPLFIKKFEKSFLGLYMPLYSLENLSHCPVNLLSSIFIYKVVGRKCRFSVIFSGLVFQFYHC